MALRIFVNDELNELYNGLSSAHAFLRPGGTCAAVAFTSLEDRIIKRVFQGKEIDLQKFMTLKQQRKGRERSQGNNRLGWKEVGKQPVEVSEEEVRKNPRARSAKLRVAQKV